MEENTGNEVTRREFLRTTVVSLGSVIVIITGSRDIVNLFAGTDSQVKDRESSQGEYDPTKHQYVYLIDITKCIGCGACMRACEKENNVPPHYFRTWIERYMVSRAENVTVDSPNGGRDGFEPLVMGEVITKAFFVPKLCNHCTNTPCVQLCPVGASYRSSDGIVLVDEERCIGCAYCVQACPYGSRFIHPVTHTASKCTLCYHRITKGMLPACVQACPVEARMLGDRKKIDDKVSDIIATKAIDILKPELLTEPNCYYVGFSKEIR